MSFFVEMKAAPGRIKSMFCVYGKDWESPGFTPFEFETEEEAMAFYRVCVEDERDLLVHSVGIRRAGENLPYLTWNDR